MASSSSSAASSASPFDSNLSADWLRSMQAAMAAGDIALAKRIHAWGVSNMHGTASVVRLLADWAMVLAPIWQQTHKGRRVRLRPPIQDDAPFFVRCFQDDRFMAQFHPTAPRLRTEAAIRRTLARSDISLPKTKAQHWLIERLPHDGSLVGSGELIGLISVVDLVVAHRRAELLIGMPETKHRGAGLATEAALLVLDVCFNHVGLNKLTSMVLVNNPHSQRSTLALGFAQEGYRRAHLRLPGSDAFIDCFENGLTACSFRSNQRLSRISQRLLGRDIVVQVPNGTHLHRSDG